MNWAELQGDWKWASALLMTWWPKFTDRNLEEIAGRRDNLRNCLQHLYGYGEMEAEGAIASFEKDVRFLGR
jgi:uncharacterized protein YjbJ (UPF0337 family)